MNSSIPIPKPKIQYEWNILRAHSMEIFKERRCCHRDNNNQKLIILLLIEMLQHFLNRSN